MRSLGPAGLLVCAVALAAACGPAVATHSPGLTATSAPTPRPPDMPLETPPSATALPAPATVLPVVIPDAIPVAIFESVLAEAVTLSGVQADQIALVRAEPAVWSDGSLGCPRPDEMYTQALVNGYWIVLEAAGVQYDFRVGNAGTFKLCPQSESTDPDGPY